MDATAYTSRCEHIVVRVCMVFFVCLHQATSLVLKTHAYNLVRDDYILFLCRLYNNQLPQLPPGCEGGGS